MQRWPIAHAAAAPQRQAPAAEQLSDRASHTAQVEPASPHVRSDRVAQVAPWQQPLGHELASQIHRPPAQRWPPAHAAPEPHSQAPLGPHRLALLVSQPAQVAPPMPHVPKVGRLQTPAWQQPPGQEAASQTHAPFMQRCPLPQGGPPPQRQAPIIEQVSALSRSQPMQAAPAVPQVDVDRG